MNNEKSKRLSRNVIQLAQYLPNVHETLSLIPSCLNWTCDTCV